ncbi:MAG: GWxTD domain-containing protein [Candidatus Eisenbacteria bacterium]|nr:GWxTD domain-containing protein [Candidatus Eisenbacteria bacterium]
MRNESAPGSDARLGTRRIPRLANLTPGRLLRLLVSLSLLAPVCLSISGCASTAPGHDYMARYQRASRFYQEKKYESALTELKPVLIHFPVWIEGSLLYARAARATETIEGRRQASQILVKLVSNYPERRDIRHELASLYFEQGFFSHSKSQYETLIKSDDEDGQSHYMLGLIVQRDWKRYRNQRDLSRMIAEFTSSAQTDTTNKEALSHLVLAYLERERPDSMQFVLERLLRGFPTDPDAIMLSAIAHHEKGEYERSIEDWKKFFSVCDSPTKETFDDISLLITPKQRIKLKHFTRTQKEQFVRTFWKGLDPTPTTELNERVLEHWRRVGLSKALFTIEKTGTPGWQTGPGEALIRYGFPKSREYTFTSSGTGAGASLPTLIWYYFDDNGPFAVAFVDYALSGEFQYFEFPAVPVPSAIDARAYYSPSYYDHNYHAHVFQNLFASAGFLGDSCVREELYVGIPLENVTKGNWRLVSFDAVVFDSLWKELARVGTTLEGARTYAERGAAAVLIRELDFKLAPGEYTVAVAVKDSVSGTLGLTKEKVVVPSFSSHDLGVSDIELAYLLPERRVETGIGKDKDVLPNPSGTYVSPAPLRLYYEVYNLAQGRDGRYRFTTKYSILPSSRRNASLWGFLVSLFGSGEHYIVSSFDREVERSSSAERLSIDISALRDGSYNLVLEVEDSVSRQRVTTERAFDKVSIPGAPFSD